MIIALPFAKCSHASKETSDVKETSRSDNGISNTIHDAAPNAVERVPG